MVLISLFLLSSVLWEGDCGDGALGIRQLYDYSVDISWEEGVVSLKGDPWREGFSAAWFSIDEDMAFESEDVLKVSMKVNRNEVRLRYLYRREGREVYFGGEEVITAHGQWQKVEIPFSEGKPFYSSDYPYALTPGKRPCVYLFIENRVPGEFDVELDSIWVFRPGADGGER